jgi:hypothetical protein
MVHVISIHGSEKQRSKMRNGHKIRIKHGKGFNVIVSPNTYHLVNRTFSKQRGMELKLSPEELEMNRNPSPEIQAHIMGNDQPLLLPGVGQGLHKHKKGSGIEDFFKNMGNTIKSGFENTIQKPFEEKVINPIKQNIVDPAKAGYNQYVKPYEGDIKTAMKLSNPIYGYSSDFVKGLIQGKKPGEIVRTWGDDLKHLNDTKNKIIRSDPRLTQLYKTYAPKLAGVAAGTLATTAGYNPWIGGVAGVAATKAAEEALKAEGYGLHHLVHIGLHHNPHLMIHHHPIGGAIRWRDITNFFKNAGNKVISHVNQHYYQPAKVQAKQTHNWLLDHPEFAQLLKHHGSKLIGLAAKAGTQYLTGSEDLADIVGDAAHEGSYMGAEEIGYGFFSNRTKEKREKQAYGTEMSTRNPLHPEHQHPADNPEYDAWLAKHRSGDSAWHRWKNAEREEIENEAKRVRDAHNRHLEEEEADKARNVELANSIKSQRSSFDREMDEVREKMKNRKPMKKDKPFTPIPHTETPSFWTKLYNWWFGKGNGLYAGSGPNGHGLYGGDIHNNVVIDPRVHHFGRVMPPPPPHMLHHSSGGGFHSYESLRHQNIGSAHSNSSLAKMNDLSFGSMNYQDPIKRYWDGEGQPLSRGTGLKGHHHSVVHHVPHTHHHNSNSSHDLNLISGRGRLMGNQTHLPPALQSQPYGSNFHMQFFLPPEYHKFNDGTNVFG